MQFSRYIVVKAFALTVRFEDSNFNIFHPLQRNTDVKSLCGSTIISFHSMRCTFSLRFKLCFARFHQVKNAVTPLLRFATQGVLFH